MSDERIVRPMRRMTRREALRLAAYAGAAGGALGLIQACGGGGTSGGGGSSGGGTPANQKVQLVYAIPKDNTGVIPKLVDEWNSGNPKTQVQLQQTANNSADMHNLLLTSFTSKSATPDVINADVIWPGEFAAARWIRPLDDFLGSVRKQVFDSAIKVGEYKGKAYAVQLYYDSGQIYYRKDLLQKYGVGVPKTMDDLVSASKKIQAGERASNPNFWGFIWGGAKIENLVDEFLEWYWSLGGNLAGKNGGIQFDNDKGRKALQFMVDTIHKDQISPPGTTTYKPADLVPFMQNGTGAFMRNWQFAWALVEDQQQSKVAGKVGIVPIPGGGGATGHGCTGGWCLTINANSKYPDRAWQFMQHMLGKQVQTTLALDAADSPVRPDVLAEPQVKQNPFFAEIPQILKTAKSRPQLRNYTQISAALQTELSAAVVKQKSVADALKAGQQAVDQLQSE